MVASGQKDLGELEQMGRARTDTWLGSLTGTSERTFTDAATLYEQRWVTFIVQCRNLSKEGGRHEQGMRAMSDVLGRSSRASEMGREPQPGA